MGAGDNSYLFREDFRSRGDQPAKPTLFERFKLWRGGEPDAATRSGAPSSAPMFAADLAPAKPVEDRLEDDFRQEFSSRLEEVCEVQGPDQDGSTSLGAAQPADAALYLHEVAAGERSSQAVTLGQVSGSLEGLSRMLESIHDRLAEASQRGGEVQDLLADLPEVVQALPAIGRGQLSILSGISSEQRAIGAETVQQFERQIERIHDLAGAIGTVQERTTEVVRSVDELRDVLGVLPASLQAQAEMLDLTRRNLEDLHTQNLEESARLLAGFERQEDVLVEGFVNQTIAIEGVRDGLTELARKFGEDSERQAEIVRPNWGGGWRGGATFAAAAVMLLTVGFGVATVVQGQRSGDSDQTSSMLAALSEERSILKEQMEEDRTRYAEAQEKAEIERADYMNRLANMMELIQRTAQLNKGLENDLAVLKQRLKTVHSENNALRVLASANTQDVGVVLPRDGQDSE